MRISMQSDQLGSVEVRAQVVGGQLGAAISVDKRDAHTALAVELPALQQSLSDKQLTVQRVVLLQGSLNSTMGDAHAQHQADRNPARSSFASPYLNAPSAQAPTFSFVRAESAGVFTTQGRLSVRA
jgi:flagellar hook-length control protein FliK